MYGIAEPLDMAVMIGVGIALPTAQVRFLVVPSTTLRVAVGVDIVREMTISRSP